MKKLPHYKIEFLKGQTNSIVCSLVEEPATQENFMLFAKSDPSQVFAAVPNQRKVMGVMMIPNKPIYRNDSRGEYTVEFTPDAIQDYVNAWAMSGRQNKISFQHSGKLVPNVFLTESMIVDSKRGINTPKIFGKTYPDGTWICTHYFADEKTYNDLIVTGKLKGFSVEGMFDLSNFNAASRHNFAEAKAKDGAVIYYDGKFLEEGVTVWVVASSKSGVAGKGEKMKPMDGPIVMEDGMVINVVGGKITEVKLPEGAKPQITPDASMQGLSQAIDFLTQYKKDREKKTAPKQPTETRAQWQKKYGLI